MSIPVKMIIPLFCSIFKPSIVEPYRDLISCIIILFPIFLHGENLFFFKVIPP